MPPPPERDLRAVVMLAVWAMLVGAVLLGLWPPPPPGRTGWMLLVVAGPPVYVAIEWLGSRGVGDRTGRRISPGRLSWRRVASALVIMLALLLGVWFALKV